MEVLGLDVDESRRELWACTGRDELGEDGRHDFGEAPRANAMVVYSLETGEQLRRWYRAPSDPIHMWNDVSVAPDGTAYFTDMSASQVHRIVPGGEPELLERLESWNYPNGIAVGDDGRLLYVACLEGIRVIDLIDGGSTALRTGDSIHTGLGDGMALRGRDLFLVQNNRLLGFRVLHCRLSEDGRAVVWDESLRFDRLDPMMPFTCALGESELFVNLTLGFDRYDAMLASEDPDPMRSQESRILSLSYRR
jgi:sugar lactone lactonase YvrE